MPGGERTLAQGALVWILTRSRATIPVPGFLTIKQVEENAQAMRLGLLTAEQMSRIDVLLGRA